MSNIDKFLDWLDEQLLYSEDYWRTYEVALQSYNWLSIGERREIAESLEWFIFQENNAEAFIKKLKEDIDYSINYYNGNGQHLNSNFWMRPQTANKLNDALVKFGV